MKRASGIGHLKPFLPGLETLLEDPEVSEIMINGPGNVWIERGGRLEPHEAQHHLRFLLGTPPLGYLLTTCGRLVLPRLLGHHVPFSLDPLSLPIYCPEKSGALKDQLPNSRWIRLSGVGNGVGRTQGSLDEVG